MLFKQWNEISEPRHQLDAPTIFGDNGSLHESPLPKVHIKCQDISKFKKVIITTAIMRAMFPGSILNLKTVGELRAELILDEKQTSKDLTHSWDFDENFPNEVDPEITGEESTKLHTFATPIEAFDDTLLINLRENSLKVLPILLNQISKEFVDSFLKKDGDVAVIVLGTSDQVSELQSITSTSCGLRPPEFVTGFIGSVLTQLVTSSIRFEGYIAPSEGPVGFEKLTLETVENLVEVVSKWIPGGVLGYADECYRRWRLDGRVSGAQSGLYI